MQKLFSNPWKVLLVLTGLSLVMRFFSFFPSVIDHDESTYILIADALRRGQVYLRDVFDTKPVGIFLLFALFQVLFGKTVIAIRVLTSVWIALTAWMIYLTHRQLAVGTAQTGYNPAPVSSGIIYIFITSIFTLYGISPNTELYFNLFTITSLFLILRYQGLGWYFLAGLLLGMGFMIKYVVLFDAIALGLFFIWQQVTAGKAWWYWFIRCTLMGVAFLIPFVLTWSYYRHEGLGDTFWFYSFELSGRYVIQSHFHDYLNYVWSSFYSFLPVTFWFIYCLVDRRSTRSGLVLLGVLWGVLDMIIILLPGKLFPHYFVQFMLPLSLVAGSFFDPGRNISRAFSWMKKPSVLYPFLSILLLLNVGFQKHDFYDKIDYSKEVASYLNSRLQPGDVLYTGDYHQIIYLLTGTYSPTPYIHSSLIWLPENSHALNIDPVEEMNKIIQQHPRFILIRYPLLQDNPLYNTLQIAYTMVKLFDKEVMVYEKK